MPRPLAHLILHEFFDGERPAEIHIHRGEVVHPVGVGDPLPRREIFTDLFRTPMEIADVGLDLGDDFAVGAEHEPEHAMRAGMLRPHVDEHLVCTDVEFDDPRIVVDELCHGGVFVLFKPGDDRSKRKRP